MNDAAPSQALRRIGMLVDAGRDEPALQQLRAVLAASPQDVEALTLLGRVHAHRRDADGMLEAANALARADPDSFFAHLLASQAFLVREQYEPALRAAQESARRAPTLPACHRQVAMAASEVPGQRQLAWEAANHAVALDPQDAAGHTCVGTVALEAGHHEVAERAFVEALRLDPEDDLAHHNLAVLRTRQGRLVEATGGLLATAALEPRQDLVPRNLRAVVLVWLQRTHLALWGVIFLLAQAHGSNPGAGVVPAAYALAAAAVALGIWWTRRTVLRLGSHARGILWRVLHGSGFTMFWFWSLAVAAVAALLAALVPVASARAAGIGVAFLAVLVGCVASWSGAAVRRRLGE